MCFTGSISISRLARTLARSLSRNSGARRGRLALFPSLTRPLARFAWFCFGRERGRLRVPFGHRRKKTKKITALHGDSLKKRGVTMRCGELSGRGRPVCVCLSGSMRRTPSSPFSFFFIFLLRRCTVTRLLRYRMFCFLSFIKRELHRAPRSSLVQW